MAARIQQQSEGVGIIVSARESFAGIAKEFSFSAKSTVKKLSGIQNKVQIVQLTLYQGLVHVRFLKTG